MRVAIEGCCHGELDQTYAEIASLEKKFKYKVDLLLICGDFQAIRNTADLQCMAVPQKYRRLGGFYRYYTGEKVAPLLTIVIGGNHEASNYMWELHYGGYLAPNIYYLGAAGCIRVNGLRIAGASGIYNGFHYKLGNFEALPYNNSDIRSIYHTRHYNIVKLSQLAIHDSVYPTKPPDIFLSHDWPQHIARLGNLSALIRSKPFFRSDIDSGRLGSPPLMELLKVLKPSRWFSAHLHVRYEAKVVHGAESENVEIGTEVPFPPKVSEVQVEAVANPDEIVIDDDVMEAPSQESVITDQVTKVEPATVHEPESSALADSNPDEIMIEDDDIQPSPAKASEAQVTSEPTVRSPSTQESESVDKRTTRFLALDKCLPRRQYLEIIDIPSESREKPTLAFDPVWLAITRAFHPYLSLTRDQRALPTPSDIREMVHKEIEWVVENVGEKKIDEVQKFGMTAPGPSHDRKGNRNQPPAYLNPQTEAFCDMLSVENIINSNGLRTGFRA